jgi:hypothetical protein
MMWRELCDPTIAVHARTGCAISMAHYGSGCQRAAAALVLAAPDEHRARHPLNHRHDVADLAPPLGLLCLASAAKALGASTAIVDLTLDSCARLAPYYARGVL